MFHFIFVPENQDFLSKAVLFILPVLFILFQQIGMIKTEIKERVKTYSCTEQFLYFQNILCKCRRTIIWNSQVRQSSQRARCQGNKIFNQLVFPLLRSWLHQFDFFSKSQQYLQFLAEILEYNEVSMKFQLIQSFIYSRGARGMYTSN